MLIATSSKLQLRCKFVLFAFLVGCQLAAPTNANEPPATSSKVDPQIWAEATKRAYRPITESDLAASRANLLTAIQSANTILDTMPAGGVLRRESNLIQLQRELENGSRDLDAFRNIYRLIARKMPKQVEAEMDVIRKLLWKHIGQIEWSSVADAQKLFHNSVDQIHSALMAGSVNTENLRSVQEAYAWLAKSGLVDQQLRQAREQLSEPNEYIRLHSSFVKNLIPEAISKVIPFDQKMDKVHIRGSADVNMKAGLEFVPNNNYGEFRLVIEGTGIIPITAGVEKAEVRAKSKLRLLGKLCINVKTRGLELGQDDVCVKNILELQKVCLRLRSQLLSKALTPLATHILKRLLPKANQKIEETMKKEIAKQLNESGFAIIVQLNSILNQVLWETVDARDVDTQSVVWTTAEEFQWQDETILPSTLGATTSPHGFGLLKPTVQFQLHESALNNASVVLCRRRYNEVLFRELVYETLGVKPISEPVSQGGRIPAAFTFANEEPLHAKFQNSSFELQLRIQSFEWENVLYSGEERTATVKYAVMHQGDQVLLEQMGETQLEPPIAEDPILQQVLSRFFVRQAQIGRSSPSMNPDTKINLVHVTIENGWAQVGLNNGIQATEMAH